MTMTFDLGGHGACGWCESSSSIRIPNLKFVGLAIPKIWRRCVSALIGLVTLTFDRLTLKLVCESHLRWGTFLLNLGTLALWVELFAMYTTDGRTKVTHIASFPTGAGGIIYIFIHHNNLYTILFGRLHSDGGGTSALPWHHFLMNKNIVL